eukprot:3695382-Pleurochrysis_carterae.AAC.1
MPSGSGISLPLPGSKHAYAMLPLTETGAKRGRTCNYCGHKAYQYCQICFNLGLCAASARCAIA